MNVENTGKHLHSLIERTTCGAHNAPEGIPCWRLDNDLTRVSYPAACGKRIKKAGFNGKISPQSMRAKAPAKRIDVPPKKVWKKTLHKQTLAPANK